MYLSVRYRQRLEGDCPLSSSHAMQSPCPARGGSKHRLTALSPRPFRRTGAPVAAQLQVGHSGGPCKALSIASPAPTTFFSVGGDALGVRATAPSECELRNQPCKGQEFLASSAARVAAYGLSVASVQANGTVVAAVQCNARPHHSKQQALTDVTPVQIST